MADLVDPSPLVESGRCLGAAYSRSSTPVKLKATARTQEAAGTVPHSPPALLFDALLTTQTYFCPAEDFADLEERHRFRCKAPCAVACGSGLQPGRLLGIQSGDPFDFVEVTVGADNVGQAIVEHGGCMHGVPSRNLCPVTVNQVEGPLHVR